MASTVTIQHYPKPHGAPNIPSGPIPTGGSGDTTGDYGDPVLKDIITAGTGTKVTVDAKGRVTALGVLVAADIPDITEAHVTGLTTDLDTIDDRLDALEAGTGDAFSSYYEPVANGDTSSPEIIFADGDVVMVKVPV